MDGAQDPKKEKSCCCSISVVVQVELAAAHKKHPLKGKAAD